MKGEGPMGKTFPKLLLGILASNLITTEIYKGQESSILTCNFWLQDFCGRSFVEQCNPCHCRSQFQTQSVAVKLLSVGENKKVILAGVPVVSEDNNSPIRGNKEEASNLKLVIYPRIVCTCSLAEVALEIFKKCARSPFLVKGVTM